MYHRVEDELGGRGLSEKEGRWCDAVVTDGSVICQLKNGKSQNQGANEDYVSRVLCQCCWPLSSALRLNYYLLKGNMQMCTHGKTPNTRSQLIGLEEP